MCSFLRPNNLVLVLLLGLAPSAISLGQSWKFGVMADTQWTRDDGRNPGSCAVDMVKAINKELISHKVDFVIEVGDLVDKTGNTPASTAGGD